MRAPYLHVLDDQESCWCIPIRVDPIQAGVEEHDLLDLDEEEFEELMVKLEILSLAEPKPVFIHVDNNLLRYKHGHPADSYFLEYRF